MSPTRVMVVEDEPIVALNLREQLSRLGYSVVGISSSGRKTLSLLDQLKPDVLLMDINIEGDIDGIETVEKIPSELVIPVIYLTAYAEEATIRRAKQTSPCGYLLKPFSERELHATIQMGLARSDAERLLRSQQKLFRDFSLMSSDWFWETDAELRFMSLTTISNANDHITELYVPGKTRLELIGAGISDEQRSAHLADLEAHRCFRLFDFEQICRDGEIHYFSVSGDPIFNPEGEFKGYRGTGRDITERVRREELLKQAWLQAESANHAKSEFLASMSHEFRTPLNAILGFSEIIQNEIMGSIEPPVYRKYGSYIQDAGSHLLNLINDVLDLSKMEAGRLELHLEPGRIESVIHASLSMIQDVAETMGVSVAVTIAPNLPIVMIDALRLKQVLLNLLSNAVKFTTGGGKVAIEAAVHDRGIILTVSDTGIGMSPEDIPLALMPFQQIDQVISRRYQGTGLGLSLAKRLTELHEGKLEIDSQLGLGTTVRVVLPKSLIVT